MNTHQKYTRLLGQKDDLPETEMSVPKTNEQYEPTISTRNAKELEMEHGVLGRHGFGYPTFPEGRQPRL